MDDKSFTGEKFSFRRPTCDKTRDLFTGDVNPSAELVLGPCEIPVENMFEERRCCASSYTNVETERDKRIKSMLLQGYIELSINPNLGTFKILPEQLYCRITEKWLRDVLPCNDKMTIADCIEAARIFIDKGTEALKELYGCDSLRSSDASFETLTSRCACRRCE